MLHAYMQSMGKTPMPRWIPSCLRGSTLRFVMIADIVPWIIDYSVVLVFAHDGRETVRVYDGAHGVNELHRHTRAAGKQPADAFHGGTLGEGMRAAIEEWRKSIWDSQ